MNVVPTPSQTVGPFFNLGLTMKNSIGCLAGPGVKGDRLKLICAVLEGDARPINDAMIEVWQANAAGKYNHPEDTQEKPIDPKFLGFGRLHSDEGGICVFETIKPGRVPGPGDTLQAPHLNLSVFARGVLKRLVTRAYFAGEAANAEDPVLALVPQGRRDTLMTHADPKQLGVWRFNIHLCGEQETVFFDV
jgi:protocatechuate 3,4-dioxygenase, alpha subunit